MAFRKTDTALAGVALIQPDVFGDSRGFFMELFNAQSFEAIGLGELDFVQDNLSRSAQGAIRGLHFQAPPYAQGKLVSVLQGEVLDVVVDIRTDSPTYGSYVAEVLSEANRRMMYVPPGFAHGFQVLSPQCLFFYKCTGMYNKASEGGLRWNDPELALPWQDFTPIVSEKDMSLPTLKEFISPF